MDTVNDSLDPPKTKSQTFNVNRKEDQKNVKMPGLNIKMAASIQSASPLSAVTPPPLRSKNYVPHPASFYQEYPLRPMLTAVSPNQKTHFKDHPTTFSLNSWLTLSKLNTYSLMFINKIMADKQV